MGFLTALITYHYVIREAVFNFVSRTHSLLQMFRTLVNGLSKHTRDILIYFSHLVLTMYIYLLGHHTKALSLSPVRMVSSLVNKNT